MDQEFRLSHFRARFPDDDACLEEIKRRRFPDWIRCDGCERITIYYKLSNRTAYSCKFCRHQVYPLAGTIFERTTTPLQLWFYAMFLMTHTRAAISVKQLQRELGVTYKTAWRMYKGIHMLMAQNKGDLLSEKSDYREHKWVFFNKLEIKFVQKRESNESDTSKK